jgi:hypothetical protein
VFSPPSPIFSVAIANPAKDNAQMTYGLDGLLEPERVRGLTTLAAYGRDSRPTARSATMARLAERVVPLR